MKGMRNQLRRFLPFFIAIITSFYGCDSQHEKVKQIALAPNISKSEIYSVIANGISIPVGHEISNDSVFETTAFMSEGEVRIEIEVQENIESFSIHPLSKNISSDIKGKKITFNINDPSNLLVKINDLAPLLIFSTPLEKDIPNENDPNVIYFGPGEHNVGRLQLQSNQTVYLAAGATVYGTLEGEVVENVTIKGRGILDGSKHTSWDERIFGIYFERSKNVTIEGIGIRNCYWWVTHFLLCENVNISHINLFSFYRNNGGLMLDGCKNYRANNSFILTNDDCICPHALNAAGNGEPVSENYTFEDMVLYNVLSGNGIRIGASFETEKCVNWLFKNIDLLAHSGAAIISDHSDWATMENLWFVNFNDEQAYKNTINFFIDSTRYSCFTGYKSGRGNMKNVGFINLNTPGGDIILKGYDENHVINDVRFYNCKIGDDIIDSRDDIVANDFVTNIQFFEDSISYKPVSYRDERAVKTTSPDQLILDNKSRESRFVGFEYMSSEQGFINNDYHESAVPEGFSNFKAAIYEPSIEGEYEVHIHWKPIEHGATNAKWIVQHRDGYTTRYMNQKESEGWQLHGTYHINGSSSVRLSLPGYFQIADGNVVADAVKFVKVK
jgi:hypothetical protein